MKLPSKINICGQQYNIVLDSKSGGGSFSESEHRITIGTRYKQHIPEVFCHEIIEVILAIRDMRYRLENDSGDNGDLLFSFSHKEFTNAIKDISAALKNIKFS